MMKLWFGKTEMKGAEGGVAEGAVTPQSPAQPEAASSDVPVAPVPVPAVSGQGGEARPKVVLKPVGAAPVHPASVAPVAAPVAAAKPAVVSLAAASGSSVAAKPAAQAAFSLKPKTGPLPAAAVAPAPPVEKRAVATADEANGVVRPKVDQKVLYYQLMNGMYDAILILDDKGHVVDCNTRFSDIFGYSREDAWDLPVDKLVTGMSNQMFEHLKSNLSENHHILIDARCYRKDGTSFPGEVGVSSLSLTRGSNVVFTIRNVERRKSAMDELRRGQAAFEVALAPAFSCDVDGQILTANQAFLDAFGMSDLEQAKKVLFLELLPDAGRAFLRAACGERVREQHQVTSPDGATVVTFELALAPIQSGQNITGVAGSILQV